MAELVRALVFAASAPLTSRAVASGSARTRAAKPWAPSRALVARYRALVAACAVACTDAATTGVTAARTSWAARERPAEVAVDAAASADEVEAAAAVAASRAWPIRPATASARRRKTVVGAMPRMRRLVLSSAMWLAPDAAGVRCEEIATAEGMSYAVEGGPNRFPMRPRGRPRRAAVRHARATARTIMLWTKRKTLKSTVSGAAGWAARGERAAAMIGKATSAVAPGGQWTAIWGGAVERACAPGSLDGPVGA
jgi:hypothetical protein